MVVQAVSKQVILCSIYDVEGKLEVDIAFLYGLHTVGAKKTIWIELAGNGPSF